MIKVKIDDKTITTSGHANYADMGDDIICSAVSTLVFSVMEYNEKIKGFECDINNKTNTIEITKISDEESAKVMFDYLSSSLESLSMQYPKHVKIVKE